MPGPPPNGASSTLWCTSCAQDRRSCTANSMMPRSAALPSKDTRSGLKYSGKIVIMSIFTTAAWPGTGVVRRGAGHGQVEQAGRRVDDYLPGGHVYLGDDRGHEGHEHLFLP